MLDDEPLKPDSSKMNGVYYEINKTVREFEGDHVIVYTNAQGKEFREPFYFSIMELKTNIQSPVRRKDLVFELAGLDSNDFVHVVMTDTSFYSRGIDRVDTVRAGRVMISQSDLDNIRNGPVFLEFYREENWPLKETTAALCWRVPHSSALSRRPGAQITCHSGLKESSSSSSGRKNML